MVLLLIIGNNVATSHFSALVGYLSDTRSLPPTVAVHTRKLSVRVSRAGKVFELQERGTQYRGVSGSRGLSEV